MEFLSWLWDVFVNTILYFIMQVFLHTLATVALLGILPILYLVSLWGVLGRSFRKGRDDERID